MFVRENPNEAIECFDKYFAAVINGMCASDRVTRKLLGGHSFLNAINEVIEDASLIAHKMVVRRYERTKGTLESNDFIDYSC